MNMIDTKRLRDLRKVNPKNASIKNEVITKLGQSEILTKPEAHENLQDTKPQLP